MITAVRDYEVVLGISRAFQHAPLVTQFLIEPVETHVPKSIYKLQPLDLDNSRIEKGTERMAQFSRL
jgi:hypothetical protein